MHGLLIIPTHDPDLAGILSTTAGCNIPMVLLGRGLFDHIHWVSIDFEQGARRLALHLLELGHRRIVFLYGITGRRNPTQAIFDGRLVGLEHAMHEHGLSMSKSSLVHCGSSMQEGYKAALEIFRRPEQPTAIFAINDLLALGAMQAARELGLRVPEDVSIVGFDNIPLSAFFGLTTAGCSMEELAGEAIGILNRFAIEKEAVEQPLGRMFQPELFIRNTTAPPAG